MQMLFFKVSVGLVDYREYQQLTNLTCLWVSVLSVAASVYMSLISLMDG